MQARMRPTTGSTGPRALHGSALPSLRRVPVAAPGSSSGGAAALQQQQQQQRGPVAPAALPLSAVSNLASGLVIAVGGYLWLQQQERMAQESPDRRPCPMCEGRGFEPCHCTRWSDGDAGCGSCSHSGYMRCRACGGGGTAVPIKVTIPARGPPRQ